ncbi:MAG: peptidoglycan DD-metalloendopeptidase family protein [Flavobacteriales bacterium]|nr:peptidoglycan DD-metalloendopeptidase family protein [Flavobacteriales bacterium]
MSKHYALLFTSALSCAAFAQESTTRPILSQRNHPGALRQAPPGRMVKVEIPHSECLTEAGYAELLDRIALNREQYGIPTISDATRGAQPFFIWPTRPRADFTDYGYYTNNNFVDHNPLVNGNLLDWNCGTRTYDWASGNHMGTDIILWPYAWRRMAEEVMEVVAAAPGTIVDKRDGYFDLQCANNGQPTWNGMVIEHADGSTAIYMHFKNGGITTKGIGETVVEGEYLGLAGSSGSSNWPHLHFEVHDNTNAYIDPFAGPCNSFNGTTTWWQQQQNYKEPNINHISTHYTSSEFYQCGVQEITYEQSNFMPGDSLIMRCYYRDLDNNALTNLVIRDAQSNVVASWDFYSPWLFGATTWAWWYYLIDNSWTTGNYTFEATFDGETFMRPFTVGMPIGMEEIATLDFSVAPNPANESVRIAGLPSHRALLRVIDATGRVVLSEQTNGITHDLGLAELSEGVYQLQVEADGGVGTRRIIVAR